MAIQGKLSPLGSKVFITSMNFGEDVTKGGIVLTSDDGKSTGIHPRWAKVFAIGPDQQDVAVGEWILLEHGRWSRGHKYETETGDIIDIYLADINAMLLASSDAPTTPMRTVIGALNLHV